MAKAAKETPLMKQYNPHQGKIPRCLIACFAWVIFMRLIGTDAIKAAGILGIILTKRGAGSTSETALAGFPHHSLNTYLPKLVKAGCRVAICDQLEDPKMTKDHSEKGSNRIDYTLAFSLTRRCLGSERSTTTLAAVFFEKNMGGFFFGYFNRRYLGSARGAQSK